MGKPGIWTDSKKVPRNLFLIINHRRTRESELHPRETNGCLHNPSWMACWLFGWLAGFQCLLDEERQFVNIGFEIFPSTYYTLSVPSLCQNVAQLTSPVETVYSPLDLASVCCFDWSAPKRWPAAAAVVVVIRYDSRKVIWLLFVNDRPR